MAKTRKNEPREPLEPTIIGLVPHYQLAANVICQAFRDIYSRRIETSLEAFTWLLDDGILWLNMIGFTEIDEERMFNAIMEVANDKQRIFAKPKHPRAYTNDNRGDEYFRIDEVSENFEE